MSAGKPDCVEYNLLASFVAVVALALIIGGVALVVAAAWSVSRLLGMVLLGAALIGAGCIIANVLDEYT